MTTERKNEIILFCVAVLLALFIFIPVYLNFGEKALHWGGLDTAQYHILADNLLAGNGLSLKTESPFTPSATRTPGYPFLLAASKYLAGNSVPIILLQILAFGGIAVLTHQIGIFLLGDTRRARLAAFLLIAELQMLYFALLVMSDIFFIFLFLFSVLLLLNFLNTQDQKQYFGASFLLGLSTLVRPNGILLIAMYAIFAFLFLPEKLSWQRRVFVSVFGVALFILPVLPWSLRNYHHFGTFRLTAADTYNLYFYPPKRIAARMNGTALPEERIRFAERLEREAGCTDFEAHDTFKCSAWMERESWKIIKAHPLYFLEGTAYSLLDHLTAADWVDPFVRWRILKPTTPEGHHSLLRVAMDRDFAEVGHQIMLRLRCGVNCVASSLLLLLGRITWTVITILATLGFISLWNMRRERANLVVSGIVVLYVLGVNSFFLTYFDVAERFRLPIFPFLFVFAVAGWTALRSKKFIVASPVAP